MTSLLVITGDGDPTAELLVEAARRLGVPVSLVDLRHHRLSVRVGGGRGAAVLNGTEVLRPAVVVNTSLVNGLGLAGADGLLRQQSSRWQYRHSAAREEQGLLLSALGLLRRQGAVLVNGPEACDLALMPNAVVDRLDRSGIATNFSAEVNEKTEILVAGGRGIVHTGVKPEPHQIDLAIAVASEAEFELGSGSIVTRPSGHDVVSGWTHRPDLSCWPDRATCAIEILRSFPTLRADTHRVSESAFFVEDLADP